MNNYATEEQVVDGTIDDMENPENGENAIALAEIFTLDPKKFISSFSKYILTLWDKNEKQAVDAALNRIWEIDTKYGRKPDSIKPKDISLYRMLWKQTRLYELKQTSGELKWTDKIFWYREEFM